MHLVVAFASVLWDEASRVLPTLALPNLSRLLARAEPAARDAAEPWTLSPPHERTLAHDWGWHGADGAYPFAALAARADGIEVDHAAWGLVTPAHWQLGRDHVTLIDPEALALDAAESRALFDALRALFEGDGYAWAWGAPSRWYAAHDALDGLACASLDRVIGRRIEPWLEARDRAEPRVARVRRLQSEVQLALHAHAANDAREARGALAVNSFWLSGCGRSQARLEGAASLNTTLRASALRGDLAAWSAAWQALDAGTIADLCARAERGEAVSITLCGERAAQRFDARARPWWQRLAGARAHAPQAWLAEL
jgi:hypothetical protein